MRIAVDCGHGANTAGKRTPKLNFDVDFENDGVIDIKKGGYIHEHVANVRVENLKTLVIAVIGAVGVIILAKNVMEFAQAYQQQDSSTMNSALKGIVAGVMMAGISTVLTFLGF